MGTKKVNIISLSLRFIIGFVWLSFWSLISICLMIICLPFRTLRIKLGNFTGKMIGPVVTRITGTKLSYSNYNKISENKPAIYVMNHASSLDIFVAMALCRYGGCGFVKKEIIRIDSMRIEMQKMVDLLVLKKNFMERKKVLKKSFLIKKKDFQVKKKILETKFLTIQVYVF